MLFISIWSFKNSAGTTIWGPLGDLFVFVHDSPWGLWQPIEVENRLSSFLTHEMKGALSQAKNLCFDSRKVDSESLFFAIRGGSQDGHDYLSDVCAKHPVGVVVEDRERVPGDYNGMIVVVQNGRQALAQGAHFFYGEPSKKLKMIGVTGTNGKSSTVQFIESLFTQLGESVGILGTIEHRLGTQVWQTELTTPDPITLNERLKEMLDKGASMVAMETSSHAISQYRTEGLHYDVGIFLNLTQDHLDYHSSMEDYFRTKERLATELLHHSEKPSPCFIYNVDDEWSEKFQLPSSMKTITFGEKGGNGIFLRGASNWEGQNFQIEIGSEKEQAHISLLGSHNVYNVVSVLMAARHFGYSLKQSTEALSCLKPAKGRLERILDSRVFVDYAHTPDALEKTLKGVQEIRQKMNSSGRIICLFGCGGDRDRAKRPLMGQIALDFSDEIIVTTDNPRTEDPDSIIDDIFETWPAQVTRVTDRKKAIIKGLEMMNPEDIFVVAGKGHEDYQIVGTEKRPFSDHSIVEEWLKGGR